MNLITEYLEFDNNIVQPVYNQMREFVNLLQPPSFVEDDDLEAFVLDAYQGWIALNGLNTYDTLKEVLLQPSHKIEHYLQTSGTTSNKKIIPISNDYLEANHYRGIRFSIYNIVLNFKYPQLLIAKNLSLSGYKYVEKFNDKDIFDLSALMLKMMPYYYKILTISKSVHHNWEEKLQSIIRDSSDVEKIKSISGVPTWMISLLKEVAKKHQLPIKEVFKELKLIIHGGVNFENYRPIFESIFSDRQLIFFETFNATEGFYGFQYLPDSNLLVLLSNGSIFYEFKCQQTEKVLPIWKVMEDGVYELIISNKEGLLRYQTGDVIHLQSTNPFLFKIVGRTTEFINAFGEDVLLSQVNKALAKLLPLYNFQYKDFFVVPTYPNATELGGHEWYFFSDQVQDTADFSLALDEALQELNNNYKQKRNKSLALKPLTIHVCQEAVLESLFKVLGKHIGGQQKLKKLYNDRRILEHLHLAITKQ
jgi:hypothetical protein